VGGVGLMSTAHVGGAPRNGQPVLDAKHKADRGDDEALRAFFNTALAKTWREEAETANPEPLLVRREFVVTVWMASSHRDLPGLRLRTGEPLLFRSYTPAPPLDRFVENFWLYHGISHPT
jgi:hypothetical protein